jgi:hypothetical protein
MMLVNIWADSSIVCPLISLCDKRLRQIRWI